MLIAFIIGMYRDSGIAQHGFRSCGGDHQMSIAIAERVAHVPQMAVLLLTQNFQIRQCRMQHWIPVDQALAAVDQALIVEADKNFPNRMR